MAGTYRGARRTLDIWPGFVDALATLLILIIFVLTVFMISHFYLSTALMGQEKAMGRLNQRIAELADMLALERKTSEARRKTMNEIAGELQASIALRDKLAAKLRHSEAAVGSAKSDLETERKAKTEVISRLDLLNRQIAALREQLLAIQDALSQAETKVKEGEGKLQAKEVEIKDLGRRLNAALVTEVQRLKRYRSEFFGRLREVLGDRPDIRIVGDRFVFQSDLLFPSASATLEPAGREQLGKLATTLKEIAAKIPKEIDWVLRVDGHTDRRPIKTPEFPSNWELSTARALSAVKFLISQGIPAKRLAATGFGQFQPLAPGKDAASYEKNRRLELKFTQR